MYFNDENEKKEKKTENCSTFYKNEQQREKKRMQRNAANDGKMEGGI